MKTKKSGFTLVEILIVVVILGILAAIVIPQFTEASTEAKTSSLCTDLQTVRSQIELYKIQHNDNIPEPESGGLTWNRMTKYTDIAGTVNDTYTTTYKYGPYLQKIPMNQFNDKANVEVEAGGSTALGTGNFGWHLDSNTGSFHADTADHVAL